MRTRSAPNPVRLLPGGGVAGDARRGYEKNGKFRRRLTTPIMRRLEKFSEEPLSKAIKEHEKHAGMLMDLDARVAEVIAKLKARGFVSPYLRGSSSRRINPLPLDPGRAAAAGRSAEDHARARREIQHREIKQEDLPRGRRAGYRRLTFQGAAARSGRSRRARGG